MISRQSVVSDIAIFVLKRDVKLQLTNSRQSESGVEILRRYLDSRNLDSQNRVRVSVRDRISVRLRVSVRVRVSSYDCPDYDCTDYDR